MAIYKKRDQFVKAFRFGNILDEPTWFKEARVDGKFEMVIEPETKNVSLVIPTDAGVELVFPGDYVILDGTGHLSALTEEEFDKQYEEVAFDVNR